MKHFSILPLFFVVLSLWCQPSLGVFQSSANAAIQNPQGVQADELNARVIKLYREANFKDALPLAKKVLDLRTSSLDPGNRATVEALYNLGAIYQALYDLQNALLQFTRALEINRTVRPGDISNARLLDRIGKIYFLQHDSHKAVEPYRQALALREKTLGQEHVDVIQSVLNLALVCEGSGSHEEAEKLFQRFLQTKHLLSEKTQAQCEQEMLEFACALRGAGKAQGADNLETMLSIVQVIGKSTDGNAAPNGDSINGRALSLGRPPYPDIARAAHAGGSVEVRVVIDELGKVVFACVISGHPLLQAAAKQAAFESHFTPTTRNGKAVRVAGMISYNFVAPR